MTTRHTPPTTQDDEAETAEYIDELIAKTRAGAVTATEHELACLERYRRSLSPLRVVA